MAMPPSSFSCTAGLHELGNSTFPSLSRCWPETTLAAATARTIHGAAGWLRMFMVPPIRSYPERRFLRPVRDVGRADCSPPHHSMTLVARTSTEGGTVSPRDLAVLRLITRWNVRGYSTGRSRG